MPRYYGVTSTISIAVDRYVDRTAARVTAASANIGVLIESPDVDSRNRVTADILGQSFNIGLSFANPVEDLRNRVTGDILSTGQNLTVLFISPASDQRNRVTGDLTALAANIGITLNPPVFDNVSRSTATVTSAATNIGVTLGSPDVDNRNRITADVQALAADIGLTFDTPDVDSRNRVTADISAAATNIGVTTESPDVDSRSRVTAGVNAAAANIGVTTESPDVDSRNRVTADISALATNIGVTTESPDVDSRSRTAALVNGTAANLGLSLLAPPPSDSTVFDGTFLLQRNLAGYYTEDYNGTIMFWLQTSDRSSTGWLGGNETIWSAALGGTDRVKIYINDNLGSDWWIGIETDATGDTNDFQMPVSVNLFDGNPHFVAIRATANRYDIFVDGLKNPASGGTSGLNEGRWLALQSTEGSPVDRINVGGFQSPNVELFTGTIDEIVHARVALSDAEITALYNAGAGYLIPEIEAGADWYSKLGAAYEMDAPDGQTTWLDYTTNNLDLTIATGSASGGDALTTGGYTAVNDFWDNYPTLLYRYAFDDRNSARSTGAAHFDVNAALARTGISSGLPSAYGFSMACWYQAQSDVEQLLMAIQLDGVSATTHGGYHGLVYGGGGLIQAHSAENAISTAAFSSRSGETFGQWHFAGGVWRSTPSESRQVWGDTGAGTADPTTVPFNIPNAVRLGALNDLWTARLHARTYLDNCYMWDFALSSEQMEWVRDNQPDYEQLVSDDNANNPGEPIFAPPMSEMGGARQDYSTSGWHLAEEEAEVNYTDGIIEEAVIDEDLAIESTIAGSVATIRRLQSVGAAGWLDHSASDFTVNFFVKTLSEASRGNNRFLLGYGEDATPGEENLNNFEIWYDTADRLRITMRNGGVAQNMNHGVGWNAVDQLVMITIRKTGTTFEIITNADIAGRTTSTLSNAVQSDWSVLRIPGRQYSNIIGNYPHAMFDEMMVWSGKAIKDEDITTLWEDGVGVLARNVMSGITELHPDTGKPDHAYSFDASSGDMGTDIGQSPVKVNLTPDILTPNVINGIPAGVPTPGSVIRVLDSHSDAHIEQQTLGSRPSSVAVVLPGQTDAVLAIEFDGLDDFLDAASFRGVNHPFTQIAVFEAEVPSTANTMVADPRFYLIRVGTWKKRYNAGANLEASDDYVADTREIWVGINKGDATTEFYRNNGVLDTGDAGTGNLSLIRVGANAAPGQYLVGRMFHYSIYDGVLSDTDINAIGDKLATDMRINWSNKT